MEVLSAFICDAANISNTGNLNALGIFTTIPAPAFPAIHNHMTIVAILKFHRSEVGKHPFKLSFVDEDGHEILPSLNNEINITDNSLQPNIIVNLCDIKFPKVGMYEIDFVIDNKLARSIELQTILVQINK